MSLSENSLKNVTIVTRQNGYNLFELLLQFQITGDRKKEKNDGNEFFFENLINLSRRYNFVCNSLRRFFLFLLFLLHNFTNRCFQMSFILHLCNFLQFISMHLVCIKTMNMLSESYAK